MNDNNCTLEINSKNKYLIINIIVINLHISNYRDIIKSNGKKI